MRGLSVDRVEDVEVNVAPLKPYKCYRSLRTARIGVSRTPEDGGKGEVALFLQLV